MGFPDISFLVGGLRDRLSVSLVVVGISLVFFDVAAVLSSSFSSLFFAFLPLERYRVVTVGFFGSFDVAAGLL